MPALTTRALLLGLGLLTLVSGVGLRRLSHPGGGEVAARHPRTNAREAVA